MTRLYRRGAATLAALLATSACAPPPSTSPEIEFQRHRISVVGAFDDYNEVLRGTGVSDPGLRAHFLDFKGVVTGMRCVGHGRVTQVPADAEFGVNCQGITGVSTVTCSDGRSVEIKLGIDPDCRAAFGLGQDQFGNTMSFVYGMDEAQAENAVRNELRRSSQRPALPVYHPEEVRQQRGYNTGTAFSVAAEGYLVTSQHVVENAAEIWVLDAAGKEHEARYVAGDPENDVALLQAPDLAGKPLPLRSAEDLRKGEEVFALGYPMVQLQGQEQKATFGRVNALSGAGGDERFVQVDVPIQPGNSGGPLLDMRGRVVGVVTATLDRVAALREAGVVPQNVNYAIRSDFVLRLLHSDLGGDLETAVSRGDVKATELISETEGSVVLVIAR